MVNSIEATANYFATVTAHYNEVRVDWMRLEFMPSPAFVFNTQLSPLPFVSLPYHGPDVPSLHTTSQTQLVQIEASRLTNVQDKLISTWVGNRADPEEKTFYSTRGTAVSHIIPDMGGIYALTVLNNGATATGTNIGVVKVSWGLTLRQFRLQ
jgi:hypothetical protein